MEIAIRINNNNNNNNNNKRRSRKPLADCTNLSQTSSTSSTNNISSFSYSSSFKKSPILSSSLHKFPNTKNKPGSTHSHNTPVSKSTAVLPPTPSRPPKSSPLRGISSDEIFEPRSVYTRRQSTADKGKAIAVPTCFTPAPKTKFASDKMNDVGVTRPSKSWTVHQKKKQCRALSDEDEKKHPLPQDFIEQQRAYFAEIDAFELSEEEVGSSNELD